ncbi:hypothetical protein [Halobaculum magnesiiphilum]|uniref:Uncharacterized protein n=2 Tax=Haloferacaceae TaxID=1644056 RepID=A0A8T8WIH7_9EURY|nr:hypothetical protein [Halobaculum magnesiiphilum]QZP39533.1 hypothetical protein K6T50_18355 [Halobaculum magnesiiphilum]
MSAGDNDYELPRGLSQVLHNYTPGEVVNFGQVGVTTQVDSFDNPEELENIDMDRVATILKGRVSRFRNRTTSGKWERLQASALNVFKPHGVTTELFPLVFYCEDPECRKVHTANSPDHLTSDGNCYACGTDLTQLTFVNVHTCGHIEGPEPDWQDRCPSHGLDDYRLVRTSGGPGTWYYRCRKCGERMGGFSTICEVCGDPMDGPLPASSNRVQYAQTVVMVDIPFLDEDPEDVPGGEPWARTLAAVHLGLMDTDEDHTLESLATNEGQMDMVQGLLDDFGGDNREELRDRLKELGVPFRGRGYAAEVTDDIVPPDVDSDQAQPEGSETNLAWANVAQQLFTFIRSTEGYEGDEDDRQDSRHPVPDSLDDYLTNPGFIDRHPQAKRYHDQLADSHFRNAWVVDQFPLLNILYGRTRASPRPRDTDLHAFDHPFKKPTIPLFGDRTPSEAIIFEIDRAAIINWLLANDRITEEEAPDTDSEVELKRWFINHIETTDLETGFTSIEDPITSDIYRLLHTISHTLMDAAPEQCGLSVGSLSERILPVVPATVIYAASTESFSLGAMFTLFKTRLHPWLGDARSVAEQCILDPACREDPESAACDACIHVNLTSCEAMNRHLDRRLLTGSRDTVGFYDDEIDDNVPQRSNAVEQAIQEAEAGNTAD